jgi:hypothetical protein
MTCCSRHSGEAGAEEPVTGSQFDCPRSNMDPDQYLFEAGSASLGRCKPAGTYSGHGLGQAIPHLT